MTDVFTLVTDRILEQLNNNIIPWKKPWVALNGDFRDLAFNRFTKKPYSLLNQMLLRIGGEWASFSQWTSIGGKIKKGSKGRICVFFKPIFTKKVNTSTDPDSPDLKEVLVFDRCVLKYYTVFHVSQVENVEQLSPEELGIEIPESVPFSDAYDYAENLFSNYINRENIHLSYGGNSAYYSPATDSINLPEKAQFNGKANEFYSTAFHECTHSTGAKNRLNRNLSDRKDNAYDKEELVAEIGASTILASLGIETESTFSNSVAYIQFWSQALKSDKTFFVSACQKAQKAVDFILNNSYALA